MPAGQEGGPLALLRVFGPLVAGQKPRFFWGGLLVVVGLSVALLQPQLVRVVIDQGIQAGQSDLINRFCLILVGLLVVQAVATYTSKRLFDGASLRIVSKLRERVFRNLARQEVAFFDTESVGELNARAQGDAAQLHEFLRIELQEAFKFALMAIGAGALMVYTSPVLTGIVAICVPLLMFGTARIGAALQTQAAVVAARNAEVAETALDSLLGIRIVRIYHAESHEQGRFAERIGAFRQAASRVIKSNASLQAFGVLGSEAPVVLGIGVGGLLMLRGQLTLGSLVTFILYARMAARGLRNVSRASANFLRAEGSTRRLFYLIGREPKLQWTGLEEPATARGVVEFEDVHFSYMTRDHEPALRGVDLKIDAGEMVALVGGSGCGKSTIACLLAGYYEPTSGHVRVDGHDLHDLDEGWLRKQVTLVPADASIFEGSLADNIRFGSPDSTDAEVRKAAMQAQADEFIRAQPQGYESSAGERGARLSSGQSQRIALARAFLRSPSILILDEATAALDAETEALVKEGIRSLSTRPTVILVAHRLSTIVDVDRVLMIDAGRVVASGTHDTLLRESAAYRELVESQLTGE